MGNKNKACDYTKVEKNRKYESALKEHEYKQGSIQVKIGTYLGPLHKNLLNKILPFTKLILSKWAPSQNSFYKK